MNAPRLRFKGFSKSWNNVNLSEVSDYTKGYAFKSEDYENEGCRIIRVSDLNANSIKLNNEKIFIQQQKTESLQKYKILKNEIIITTVGSRAEMIESAVGRGIFVLDDNEGYLNQNLLKINQNDKNDNRFIYNCIKSDRYLDYVKKIQRGNANQSNITVADLFQFPISIPNLPEQEKIASFFTVIDQKLNLLKEKKEKLQLYKKGVMQQIFSQNLRFKDEKGNKFPEWEEKRLGEVIIKNSKKNKNNEHKNVESISNKLGFVNQQEYFEDRRIASKDTKNYYVINKGDFAYNPSRIDVGSLAYKFDDKISIISPLYISFSTRKEFLVDAFLLNWLNSNSFQHQMDNSFEGGVRNTLSYDNLSKIKIIHPKSLLEQQKIADFLSALDTKINLVSTQIEKTELWKNGLLQQMFV